jgi:uncharacterized membrane protein YbhN (UPF0104 family)
VREGANAGIPAVDRRKALITIGAAVALALGTVAVVGHAADWEQVEEAVEQADKGWLPLCLVGLLGAYTGYVMAYRDVARVEDGPALPVPVATRVVMIGSGATVVGASAGGLAVDFWALHRAGEPSHAAARRVLAFNTLEWAVFALGASVAGILALAGLVGGVPTGMAVGWPITTAVCALLAVWVSRGARGERLAALPGPRPPLERDPHTWLSWLRPLLRAGLADAIGGLRLMWRVVTTPHRHVAGLAGFPVYWGGNLLCLYAALRAFGAAPAVLALLIAYATAYVATALPLPAGGAGGIEASLAFSLTAIDVPLASAVLATLVFRFVTFWLPLPLAAVALAGARHLDDALAAIAAGRAPVPAAAPAPIPGAVSPPAPR